VKLSELLKISASIGPACIAALDDEAFLAAITAAENAGMDLTDAVLDAVHKHAVDNRQLGEEFVKYFLQRITGTQALKYYPAVRNYLESPDLVQSVALEFWQEMSKSKLDFRGRAPMFSWLLQRSIWKASAKDKGYKANKRRGDLQVELNESMASADHDDVESNEGVEKLVSVIGRLPEKERRLIEMKEAGASCQEMAEAFNISENNTRQMLHRALGRVQELL